MAERALQVPSGPRPTLPEALRPDADDEEDAVRVADRALAADVRLYRALRSRAVHPAPVRAASALSHFG